MADSLADGNTTIPAKVTKAILKAGNVHFLNAEEFASITEALVWFYGPVFFILGVVGVFTNLLNIVALCQSLKHPTYKIFLAMACADFMVTLLFLLFSLSFAVYDPPRLDLGVPPRLKPGVTYSFYLWQLLSLEIVNPFACISNWCAVLLAIFRLLATLFPLRAASYGRGAVVNTCIVVVYVFGFLAQIPIWMTRWFDEHGALKTHKHLKKFSPITTFLNGAVPLTISAVTTIILVIMLAKSQAGVRESLARKQREGRQKEQRRLTVTLILIVLIFVILNLPNMVYNVMSHLDLFAQHNISLFTRNKVYIVVTAVGAVSYAANFFVYIVANTTFRKDLKQVFMKAAGKILRPRVSQASRSRTDGKRVASKTTSTAVSNSESVSQRKPAEPVDDRHEEMVTKLS